MERALKYGVGLAVAACVLYGLWSGGRYFILPINDQHVTIRANMTPL